MIEYHKINTAYKRTPDGKLMVGQWSQPEFEYLKDCEWSGTEKVDGTNIRVDWRAGCGIKIGGKTDNAQIPIFLLDRLNELFGGNRLDGCISKAGALTLYGEGFGARIQKGGGNYIKDGVGFVLFDVRVDDWWLNREDVIDVARALSIPYVPEIYRGTLLAAIETAQIGFNSEWGPFLAEGMVLKPVVELQTRAGHRVITKIKHKDFLRVASADEFAATS